MEDERHARNDEPPGNKRTKGDIECVLQSDNIAETQYGSAGVDLEYELSLVGQRLTESDDAAGEVLIPPTEGGDDEVVETAHDTGDEQRLGLITALGT